MLKMTMTLSSVLAFSFALGCATTSPATGGGSGAAGVTAEADAIPHLNWDQVSKDMAAGAVLVDARRSTSFTEGHIAGAINVPVSDDNAYANLPSDKNTKLIFYCGGPACSASTKCAKKARAAGYVNVAEFKGGFPEWSEKQSK